MPAGRTAIGTIVAKNFLSFARVLGRSLREHHPEVRFFVVLADRAEGMFDPATEPFEIISLAALGIPDLHSMCFRYSRRQVTIAAKPHLLRYLLNRDFAGAMFLDADILVVDRLDPLLAATEAHAVVLTPHLLGCLSGPDAVARELNILQSGVYNGGFIGVSARASAQRFLSWWADRLHTHCRYETGEGMHYDQRWLDLAPTFFDDVHIMRDGGCNIAHWNLPERDAHLGAKGGRPDGSPCRFFHFSGFQPERPWSVTRYSRRLTMETIGPSAALFDRYVRLLHEDGYQASRDWPYAFGCFDNGVQIPDVARRMYQDMGRSAAAFGDPFRVAGSGSYFHWLNEPADHSARWRRTITRLWETVYRSRPDLQRAFPDVSGADHRAFLNWIVTNGLREHDIPEAFAPS
jgi:hypothetical protein